MSRSPGAHPTDSCRAAPALSPARIESLEVRTLLSGSITALQPLLPLPQSNSHQIAQQSRIMGPEWHDPSTTALLVSPVSTRATADNLTAAAYRDATMPTAGTWEVPPGPQAGATAAPAPGDTTVSISSADPLATQSIGTAFAGISLQDELSHFGGGAFPPDTMGAIGPDRFMEVINGAVAVYTRTGTRLSLVSLGSFLSVKVNGVSYPRNGETDPRVIYDRFSGRWFVSALEFGEPSQSDNNVILAVSRTSDPGGIWDKYVLPMGVADSGNTTYFSDYDTLGVDNNGVYVAARIFGSDGSQRVKLLATPKAPLLASTPSLGDVFQFDNLTDFAGVPVFAQPLDDASAGGTMWVVGSTLNPFLPNSSGIRYRRLTWSNDIPSLSNGAYVNAQTYAQPPDAPALGSTTDISTADYRLINAVVRDGHLWTVRAIGVNASGTSSSPSRAGVEWFDVNVGSTSLSLNDNGRIYDPAGSDPYSYYYPSVSVSGQGRVVIGFSGSSAGTYAGAYYVEHLPTDPPDSFGPVTLIRSGDGAYTRTGSGTENRWGDYSFTTVDPTDDQTLWTIQEYAQAPNANGSIWGTYIAQALAPAPTLDAVSGAANVGATAVTIDLTGSGFFDPGAEFANHLAITLAGGAVNGISNYNVIDNGPASASVTFDIALDASPGTRDIVLTNPDGQSAILAGAFTVLAEPSSVAGTIYEDSNGDGLRSGDEPLLAGWTAYADLNDNGTLDAGEPMATSGADGSYLIDGLIPGSPHIREVVPAGWIQTAPGQGFFTVNLVGDTHLPGRDFGNFRPGTIAGQVFADTNASGTLDAGESGISGWTVYLDINGNAAFDPGEPSQITDSAGAYAFDAVGPGTYAVRVVQQPGFALVAPAQGAYSVQMTSGATLAGHDFAEQPVSLVPSAPDLLVVSDSGISGTDNLTRLNNASAQTSLQFRVDFTIPGATVSLYADGVLAGSAVADGTSTVVITDGLNALAEGPHDFTARQVEPDKPASDDSPSLTVTIDTTAPDTPDAPALNPASDLGASSTDNITADTTPTFTSTAAPWFRLFRDGVAISGDYESGSYTTAAQPDGTFDYQVQAVDSAGNVSALSSALGVTFDTTAPTAGIDPVIPDPHAGAVTSIRILFSRPVFGFDATAFSLTRDGEAVSLASALLGTTDHLHFTLIGITDATALPGAYLLTLPAGAPGLTDLPGNLLANSATTAWTNTLLAGTDGPDDVRIAVNPGDPTLTDVTINGAEPITLELASLPQLQIDLGSGDDTLTVDFSNGNPLPGSTSFDGGDGADTLAIVSPPGPDTIIAQGGSFRFNSQLIGVTSVESFAPIASDGADTLTVAPGVALKLAPLTTHFLWLSELNLAGDAALDLFDNDLVLSYPGNSPLPLVRQDIVNGQTGQAGPKLIASAVEARPTALAPVDNQQIHTPAWDGVPIDDGSHQQIIVKFTYAGDTNLDGKVTGADLYGVFANQGAPGGWLQGDVNLDGLVNLDDFNLVMSSMGAGSGGGAGDAL